MNLGMFATMFLVGVLAGWAAGHLMERGGYGLRWDMVLGLAGSAVGGWIFFAVGASPAAGLAAMTGVALAGAACLIVAQRKFYPAIP
jgi:uncharacterized membrane protein YeaQ/YmgE (transglycosylase-associated protein family)